MNTSSPNGSLVSFETWVAALASSACIGFTSLVPWLFNLTFFEKREATAQKGRQDSGDSQMKYLLSFAIGAILGDIFFHLIPESIESHMKELGDSLFDAERNVGVSIIAGIFLFIIVEMVLQKWSGREETEECNHTSDSNVPKSNEDDQDLKENPPNRKSMMTAHLSKQLAYESNNNNNNNVTTDSNGNSFQQKDNESATDISDQMNNNYIASSHDQNLIHRKPKLSDTTSNDDAGSKGVIRATAHELLNVTKSLTIDPAGYLNLIANGFDNFTHGLAIGASFLVGMKVGILTTFVIFIHEIPHEICDYAILVKSGFSRWEAVKAQSSVSLFGTMGTALALYVKSVDKLHAKTVWILPFSAGGFLYIALVTLLPDILEKESNLRNSLGQIASVVLGIAFMGLVALL